jgi:2-polyprenyl-6-methoxyphenol hydroxylase-like FAD-dependent oxidoreductase
VTTETAKVAVSGGGGLASALNLEQHGIPCRVYARAPDPRSRPMLSAAILPKVKALASPPL